MRIVMAAAMAVFLAAPAVADTVWFRDPARNVSVAYDDKIWRPANPAESMTLLAVNWRLSNGAMVATCALQAAATPFGAAMDGQVHSKQDIIVESLMANLRKRDPDARLVHAEPTWADGLEAIRVQRYAAPKLVDGPITMNTDLLFTVWHGEEILLECVYPDAVKVKPENEAIVQREIANVLRTLHFER